MPGLTEQDVGGCGCPGPAGCVDCHGIGIPAKDLLCTWTGIGAVGSGSTTFHYNGLSGWGTTCIGDNLTMWSMSCSPFQLLGNGIGYPNAGCTGSVVWQYAFAVGVSSAYPFTINYTVPVFVGAYGAGWRTLTISDPSPGSRCCFIYFNVTGPCPTAGTPLQLATVSVWTNSSKTTLLATGLTDSNGDIDLNIGTAGGTTLYYEVSYPGLTTVSATTGVVNCGQYNDLSPLNVAIGSTAIGYHCLTCCGIPLFQTITCTVKTYGTFTTTQTFAMNYGTDAASGVANVWWQNPGNPALNIQDITFNPANCKVSIQGYGLNGYVFCAGSLTCPPGFSITITGCVDTDGITHDITITA